MVSYTNLERYKKDIDALLRRGNDLYFSMVRDCSPQQFDKLGLSEEEIASLPAFSLEYQSWYSEALAAIRQVLPDRASDFVSYYSPKPTRRELSNENYTIVDYLKGLQATRGQNVVVSPRAALSLVAQQITIVSAMKSRFDSSLFDIRALVQADLIDNELIAAAELNNKGYARASGALAGVVLEAHLGEVTSRRGIAPKKSHPTIADFNDSIKAAGAIEVSTWRFIQHLADIRNACDHKKSAEPTKSDIDDLLAGVQKLSKTVF